MILPSNVPHISFFRVLITTCGFPYGVDLNVFAFCIDFIFPGNTFKSLAPSPFLAAHCTGL